MLQAEIVVAESHLVIVVIVAVRQEALLAQEVIRLNKPRRTYMHTYLHIRIRIRVHMHIHMQMHMHLNIHLMLQM